MRVDPAVVAASDGHGAGRAGNEEDLATAGSSPQDVWAAFGD
jgi:hypothetical protein